MLWMMGQPVFVMTDVGNDRQVPVYEINRLKKVTKIFLNIVRSIQYTKLKLLVPSNINIINTMEFVLCTKVGREELLICIQNIIF